MAGSPLIFESNFAFIFGAISSDRISSCVIFSKLFSPAPQAGNLKQKSRSGLRFLRRIRLFLPIYYATLAALIISGSVMLPVLCFDLNFKIYFMAVGSLAMIALSAASYKRLKIAYLSQNFAPYQRKMRVILGLNLAIILIASVI